MEQDRLVEQLDRALTRFMLARARYEKERGLVIVDQHWRWTGEAAEPVPAMLTS